jgi:hypothetical protein
VKDLSYRIKEMIISVVSLKPDKSPTVFPKFDYPVICEAGRIAGAASENLEFIPVIPVQSVPCAYPHESLAVEKNTGSCIL